MTPKRPSPRRGGPISGSFQGYKPAALAFLRDLAGHNEKAWFEANRAVYEDALKIPTAALVADVASALSVAGLPLEGDPKRSSFRIHRDTRFSKDKTPYKTNIGAVWYRQGSGKDGDGVLYFHLAPAGCFMAAAFYMPDADVLGSLREQIRVRPDRFQQVIEALAAEGLALDMAESLVRMPRGFEDMAGHALAPALRLKHLIVREPVPTRLAESQGLVDALVRMAARSLPLLQFGWAAIDEARA